MSLIKKNQFIISILLAVLLAWLTPEWGASHGYLKSHILIQAGVIFIFFSQGFRLTRKAMIEGLCFWPLHLFTQFWIFLGIPLIALLGLNAFGKLLPEGLKLGIFFLAILPTTVSSAITLVSQAKGNVAGSIFNTVLANLSAVFIIPIWLFWYQSSLMHVEMNIWPIFLKLLKLLLLPFFIGHFSQNMLSRWSDFIKKFSIPMNQWIIAFIVYSAIATSFRDKIWADVGATLTIQAVICASLLLFTVSGSVLLTARILFKDSASRIAAFFTGSQKSLAVGIPYSVAFFATLTISSDDPSLKQSIIILPLLFYHPSQLLLASVALRFSSFFFGSPSKEPT